jgi:ABC-type transporter Mla subunit MlaD
VPNSVSWAGIIAEIEGQVQEAKTKLEDSTPLDQRAARLHQSVATRAQQVARAKSDLKQLEEEKVAIQERVDAKTAEVSDKEAQLAALRAELGVVVKADLEAGIQVTDETRQEVRQACAAKGLDEGAFGFILEQATLLARANARAPQEGAKASASSGQMVLAPPPPPPQALVQSFDAVMQEAFAVPDPEVLEAIRVAMLPWAKAREEAEAAAGGEAEAEDEPAAKRLREVEATSWAEVVGRMGRAAKPPPRGRASPY